MRAEADAKLAAVKTLGEAYAALRRDRDEFAARDTANVAAVRAARTAALKAGFAERALDAAGYRDIAELITPAPARKPRTGKRTADTPRRGRRRATGTAARAAAAPVASAVSDRGVAPDA